MSPQNAGIPEKPDSEVEEGGEKEGGLSAQDRLELVLWEPGVVKILISFMYLLGHIRDLEAFRSALQEDDFSEAEEYTDFSEEELRERVNSLKEDSLRLSKAFPILGRLSIPK